MPRILYSRATSWFVSRSTGKEKSPLWMKSFTVEGASPTSTASATSPVSDDSSNTFCIKGISKRQGPHQVSQKFSNTGSPWKSLSERDCPSRLGSWKSGAGFPIWGAGEEQPTINSTEVMSTTAAVSIRFIIIFRVNVM